MRFRRQLIPLILIVLLGEFSVFATWIGQRAIISSQMKVFTQ
jgi:hypothetical protein